MNSRDAVFPHRNGARRAYNRMRWCPVCQERLSFDRDAVTSENGFIYRNRRCPACGASVHTKQPPEEVTGVEREKQIA